MQDNNADMKKQEREQVVELGSDITKSDKGNIYTLTIIGQVEGHQVLPENCKTTKYEHVLPLLENIPSESPYFIQANRLIKFLKYFHDIADTWIPCNSILREFIGGSIFYANE